MAKPKNFKTKIFLDGGDLEETNIITAPFKILKEWGEKGLPLPKDNFSCSSDGLKRITYNEIDLSQNWQTFDITHELTDNGMDRFSQDWNALITS